MRKLLLLLFISMNSVYAQNIGLKTRVNLNYDFQISSFDFKEKHDFIYTSSNKLDSVVWYWYDHNTSTFDTIGLFLYTYDANDRLVQFMEVQYSQGTIIRYEHLKEYFYDNSGNLIDEKWSSDPLNTGWIPQFAWNYTYTNGLQTEVTYYMYDQNSWLPLFRYENTYNSSNQLVLKDGYDFNQGAYLYKTFYVYDSNGQLISENSEEKQGSNWVGYFWRTLSYDANGGLEYEVIVNPSVEDSIVYTVDNNGFLVEMERFRLNASTQNWILNRQSYFQNDLSGNYNQVIYPNQMVAMDQYLRPNQKLEKRTGYSHDGVGLNPSYILEFYYDSTIVSSVKETQLTPVIVYPNPAQEVLNIRNPIGGAGLIQVYNASGVLVTEGEINGSGTVSISNLKGGIYFYHILSNGNRSTGTFIKK